MFELCEVTNPSNFSCQISGSHSSIAEHESFGMLCHVSCYVVTDVPKDCRRPVGAAILWNINEYYLPIYVA